jgi:hypothetical protein
VDNFTTCRAELGKSVTHLVKLEVAELAREEGKRHHVPLRHCDSGTICTVSSFE